MSEEMRRVFATRKHVTTKYLNLLKFREQYVKIL